MTRTWDEDEAGLDAHFFAAAVEDRKEVEKKEVEKEKGPSESELRISKAKEYLKRLMDEEENEEDAVAERLQDQALRSSGRVSRKLASNLENVLDQTSSSESESDSDEESEEEEEEEESEEENSAKVTVRRYRGHQLAAACVAVES